MKIEFENNWYDNFKKEVWIELGISFVRTEHHPKYYYCFSVGFILFTLYVRWGKIIKTVK